MGQEVRAKQQAYDVAIVGGGTGGYVAAIRAAQLGLHVAVIEEDQVGGTCLHRGCIPSKAYLQTADVFRQTTDAAQFGVETSTPVLRWDQVKVRKNKLVQTLYAGVQGLLRKNKITLIDGRGVVVQHHGGLAVQVNEQVIAADKVIIATGSRPITMELPLDDQTIMTSDQALERTTLPASVVIAGGGTIGMEWASLYRDCGVEVTVIETLPRILAMEDEEVSEEMHKIFTRKGVRFMMEAKVDFASVQRTCKGVSVPVIDASGQTHQLEAESLLIAVGRRACVENIGLEKLRLVPEGPFIKVNQYQQTTYPGLYAIGDVCGGGLAHVASAQGVIAVEHIVGERSNRYNPLIVPKCTYTFPEVASVGLTEKAAKEQGIVAQVGKFPFRAIGKALISDQAEGFAKIVTEANSGEIIGVHVVGPHATELIAEGGLLLANGMNLSQWASMIHPHPSVSEVFHEAVLAVEKRAIHL